MLAGSAMFPVPSTDALTRVAQSDAAATVVSDPDLNEAGVVAEQIGGLAVGCDVASEDDVQRLVTTTLDQYGRVDILFPMRE